jgi:hypothetical protein
MLGYSKPGFECALATVIGFDSMTRAGSRGLRIRQESVTVATVIKSGGSMGRRRKPAGHHMRCERECVHESSESS